LPVARLPEARIKVDERCAIFSHASFFRLAFARCSISASSDFFFSMFSSFLPGPFGRRNRGRVRPGHPHHPAQGRRPAAEGARLPVVEERHPPVSGVSLLRVCSRKIHREVNPRGLSCTLVVAVTAWALPHQNRNSACLSVLVTHPHYVPILLLSLRS